MVLLIPKPDNVATYDYYDTATGYAVKRYYLCNLSGAALDQGAYTLTDWPSYSTFATLMGYTSSTGADFFLHNKTFEMRINRPMKVEGEIRIGCTTASRNEGASGVKKTKLMMVFQKSGATIVTDIVSGTTLQHSITLPTNQSGAKIHGLRMLCPLTKFKRGEYIKLQVNQYVTQDEAPTWYGFGCDPAGRGDYGDTTYNLPSLIRDKPTVFTIDIPFKVEE